MAEHTALTNEGSIMTKITIREERTFSVGYSAAETERLVRDTALVDTYNVYPNGVVKSSEGVPCRVGAYDGYFVTDITVDGRKVTSNEMDIVTLVVKAYKTQAIVDIARVVHTADAAEL